MKCLENSVNFYSIWNAEMEVVSAILNGKSFTSSYMDEVYYEVLSETWDEFRVSDSPRPLINFCKGVSELLSSSENEITVEDVCPQFPFTVFIGDKKLNCK